MISGAWHIQMLGGLQAQQADQVLTRFRTHQVAALLARLALFSHRSHPREELMELLWPDQDAVVGRNRLRVTLSSLRYHLEPPGIDPKSVLVADRVNIRLNSVAVITDVDRFVTVLAAADREADAHLQARLRDQAVDLYRGELLPGFYEGWVDTERQILAGKYGATLQRLMHFWESQGEYARALNYALRAASADPYHEETHQSVIRQYVKLGQPAAARRYYQELEQRLHDDLNTPPSAATLASLEPVIYSPVLVAPIAFPSTPFSPSSLLLPDAPRDSLFSGAASSLPRLPLQLTRFFGRSAELTRLMEMLSSERSESSILVTLTGPGGSGKTRLALEAGRMLQPYFPGGVWFIPLADLTDAKQILPTLQALLGINPLSQTNLQTAITEVLGHTRALLILDNMEHLPGGADVVQALREQGTGLTYLVTSRRALGLSGEREFPVLPLPVPGVVDDVLSDTVTPEQLMTIPSVQLFVDRAQSVRPDFVITRRNASDIAALCRQLEGIPLAVELAAARARALSAAQMRQRLTERWELLVNPRAEKTARHRSLRAALEWSYQLLPVAQKRLLSGLSLFRGGWTLEAAEAVSNTPALLIELEGLHLDSLVLLDGDAQGTEALTRFRMLETVREFAMAQISLEDQEEFARRHALYFVSLAEGADFAGQERRAWSERLGTETDNIRAALDWCSKTEHPEGAVVGLRLCNAMIPYWRTQGWAREGYQVLCLLLDKEWPRETDPGRVRLWARGKVSKGALACSFGESEASEIYLKEALSEFRNLDDAKGMSDALHTLGVSLGERRPSEACDYYEQSLVIRQKLGSKRDIAATLNNLAVVNSENKEQIAMVLQAQQLFREVNDQEGIAGTYHTLATLYEKDGNQDAAQSALQSSLVLFHQLGEKLGMALTLTKAGLLSWKQGDLVGAQTALHDSLILGHQLGYSQCVAGALAAIFLVIQPIEPVRAMRLVGATSRLTARLLGEPPVPPPDSMRADWELGWTMSQEQAVQEALHGLTLVLKQAQG